MKTAMLALALSFGSTASLAAAAKHEHVGDLICTVGDQSPKAAIICVFRNKNTGLEETYQGSLANAGVAKSVTPKRTLLWTVNAKPTVELKPGVLAQRYEAPESEQKIAKSVEGETKPDVSLNLITDKNDDLTALATLTLELKLLSAPA
ncbi:DUF992 domain-containing protein [Hyphomicrobium sp.]|uniref:DUF992 domain-containing protein n=1 Tax=Hyphomicrobium sp. TaxID=82 RepID=UPI0025BD2107|nr:DUF992 domain-containing protein [Hyphomicrobium sp.]